MSTTNSEALQEKINALEQEVTEISEASKRMKVSSSHILFLYY